MEYALREPKGPTKIILKNLVSYEMTYSLVGPCFIISKLNLQLCGIDGSKLGVSRPVLYIVLICCMLDINFYFFAIKVAIPPDLCECRLCYNPVRSNLPNV